MTKPPLTYSKINIGDIPSLLNILWIVTPETDVIWLRLKYVLHIIEAFELIIGEFNLYVVLSVDVSIS